MSSSDARSVLIKYLNLVSETTELKLTLALDELTEQTEIFTEYLKGRDVVSQDFSAATCGIDDRYYHRLHRPTLDKSYEAGLRVDLSRAAAGYTCVPDEAVISPNATPFEHKLVRYLILVSRVTAVLQEAKDSIHSLLTVSELKTQDPKVSVERHIASKIHEVCDREFELSHFIGDGEFLHLAGEVLKDHITLVRNTSYSGGRAFRDAGILLHRIEKLSWNLPVRLQGAQAALKQWIEYGRLVMADFIQEAGTYLYGPMPAEKMRVISPEDDQKAVEAEKEAKEAKREVERQAAMPGSGYEWMRAYATGEYKLPE